MLKKVFLFVIMGLTFVIGVNAQDSDMAHLRIVSIVSDAHPLQTFGNGAALGVLANPNDLTDYIDIPADTYEITFAPEGADASASIISPLSIQFEAERDYTVILQGSIEEDTVEADVIDETAAFGELDPDEFVPLIFINDLKDAPSVSLWVNGQASIENVAYGDVATAALPVGAIEGVQVTAADNPDDILLAPPFLVDTEFAPEVGWLFVAAGTYPGEAGQDMFLYAIPTFKGELAVTDGGDLGVRIPLEGTLRIGERIQYVLTLDDDAIINITLSASEGSPLDSYVRIYNADGELLAENDEIDFEDDTLDAGVSGYPLMAGEYWIEVSSYRDASSGSYLLIVVAA